MAQEQRSAHALIEDLKAELARAPVDDPAARERLERIVARLDERVEDEPPHQELVDELTEDVAEFEAAHPHLAATLRGFMNMLSSIGI